MPNAPRQPRFCLSRGFVIRASRFHPEAELPLISLKARLNPTPSGVEEGYLPFGYKYATPLGSGMRGLYTDLSG